MTTYNQECKDEITELLVGRKVTKVNEDTLLLDNGTLLRLEGHSECCMGYDLTELNEVDNIITNVEFVDDPAGDFEDDGGSGVYEIFVYAGLQKINLARFEGTDGNGYYGTGYHIQVTKPVK